MRFFFKFFLTKFLMKFLIKFLRNSLKIFLTIYETIFFDDNLMFILTIFFWRIFYHLTIASFRIGVPSILIFIQVKITSRSEHALGIWICGFRLFCEGGSKGGWGVGGIARGEYQIEIGTWHFLLKPASKVLNLNFQFFCIDFLGKLWKECVVIFISRQD